MSVDEEERLSQLARLQRAACAIIGVASVLPLVLVLATTAPAAVAPWHPEAVIMAVVGVAAMLVGVAASRKRSTSLLNVYFVMVFYNLFTIWHWIPRRAEDYMTVEGRCHPTLGTWTVLHDCNRHTVLAGASLGAAALLTLACVFAATVSYYFHNRLAAGIDQPLSAPKLARVLEWCDAEGDGLVCLYEFIRYHLQLKFIPPSRLSLLRHNFGECDPLGSGTLPLQQFRHVYFLTFSDTRIRQGDSVPALIEAARRSIIQATRKSFRKESRRMSLQAFKRREAPTAGHAAIPPEHS